MSSSKLIKLLLNHLACSSELMISYPVSKSKEDMTVVEKPKIPMTKVQKVSVMRETDDHDRLVSL